MADEFHEGDRSDSENPSHHNYDSSGVDLISSLPDEILQHILSFTKTKFAIRTSVLSRRWKDICWNTSSLEFDCDFDCDTSISTIESIHKTLICYEAAKINSIYLSTSRISNVAEVNSWIELAMYHKVEKLSLDFHFARSPRYNFPDFFYSKFSSLKQLSLDLGNYDMIPRCSTVSWTALKNLSLGFCNLPDESAAQILSGCPVLESLTLNCCDQLEFLDLSKSLLLRRFDISCPFWERRSKVIIAPHIHYLRLTNYKDKPSTLMDVSSLTEAELSICEQSSRSLTPLLGFQNMLAKFHNVKKLTLDANFIQVLSYAEHNGVTFPTFKVEDLKLEIKMFQSVLIGVTKMLQNSPESKKITVHIRKTYTYVNSSLFDHLDSEGLNKYDQLWNVKDDIFQTPMDTMDMEAETKFVGWLVKSLIKSTETVKTIVLKLGSQVSERGFSELVHMLPTLHNKVSIVLKRIKDYEPL